MLYYNNKIDENKKEKKIFINIIQNNLKDIIIFHEKSISRSKSNKMNDEIHWKKEHNTKKQ